MNFGPYSGDRHWIPIIPPEKKVLVMKKIMPFMLGCFLLLGATGCQGMMDTTTTDSVRRDQIESDARARAQREGRDPGTATNVTIEELSGNLANYLGQTLSVRGQVQRIAGNHAFLLGKDQLFGGKEVLVINASGQPIDLIEGEGTDVQVTGEVREFVLADIESEYGFDLDNTLFVDYENQPVIVAQSMALSPDPSDITNNPQTYYSQRLAVQGNVETILNANAMAINDGGLFGGDGLLAISPSEAITLQKGKEVVITGVLRPYVFADIEREYNLAWDSDSKEQITAKYQNKPVFIIDSIYPLRN